MRGITIHLWGGYLVVQDKDGVDIKAHWLSIVRGIRRLDLPKTHQSPLTAPLNRYTI